MQELLVVTGLWKKFSRDLKASVNYAARDLLRSSFGRKELGENLRRTEFWALQNVCFRLQRGEVLAIMGYNGAGKSTLLKCIANKVKPDRGNIQIKGELGHLLEMSAGFAPTMTGRENVTVRGQLLGKRGSELKRYVSEVAEFADIDEFFEAPVQFYSTGMRARLGFSASSVMNPDVLIIDEVLAVGDLSFRLRCYERVNEMARSAAIIFVSHSLGQIARLCNRAIYLEKGKVFYEGNVQQAISLYQNKVGEINEKKKSHVLNPDLISFKLHLDGKPWQSGDRISYGEKINLEIDVSNVPRNSQVRVVLRDASSGVIMDWNSARNLNDWPSGAKRLFADLGSTDLCPGAYSLAVQVMSSDGVEHLCLSEAIPFRVNGNLYYPVPIQRIAKWSFQKIN